MLIARYAKIVMSLSLAAFCLLVTFDNIADYGTNYLFVQHVMSMDTTFPGNTLMYRAIDDPVLWQLAYALIIAAEGVTGLLFLAGGIQLVRLRSASGAAFNQGKTLVIAGCLLAFLVWFLGFMVVAGEWFDMWQSKDWNGQDAAFRFYVTVLGVLIFVSLPDGDLAPSPASPRRQPSDKK
jgi:predicted small integral membrane protein